MIGADQILDGSRYLNSPFQRWCVIHGPEFATINLSIKFELSISTHYEDMKGDTKYQKSGGLG